MLAFFSNTAARVRRDEKGATAVEYGIMVALIAVVIIVAVGLIGGNLTSTFNASLASVKGGNLYGSRGPAARESPRAAASCK
jgi:pilus assembly protein Flp/PilA